MKTNNESPKRDFKAGQIYGGGGIDEQRLSNNFLCLITEVADNIIFYQLGSYELNGFTTSLKEQAVRTSDAQYFFGILITDAHKARFDKELSTLKTRHDFAIICRDLVTVYNKTSVVPTERQIKTLQNLINEIKQQADENSK